MRQIACFCLALAGMGFLLNAYATDVYKWTDANGTVHYSERPRADGESEALFLREQLPAESAAPVSAPSTVSKSVAPRADINVVMYATKTCGWCIRARRYFSSRGIGYQEIDIEASASAKAKFKSLGGRGTPLIFINQKRIAGFDEGHIDQILGDLGY